MKELSNERRAAIKAAMQGVVDHMIDIWNAEGELEGAIGFDVDGLGEYLKDYAGSGAEIGDEDVAAFLKWAGSHAEGPEAL